MIHKPGCYIFKGLCKNHIYLFAKIQKCLDIEVTTLPSGATERDLMTSSAYP
jgi:hypothetical protein